MRKLEEIVDFDQEIILSMIPIYGDSKFWYLTKDFHKNSKWTNRTLFYGAKYTCLSTFAYMVYNIANNI